MKVEPVTSRTPRPVRRAVLVQSWRDLTFLHWRVDPIRIAELFPPGTRPDTFDGATFIGLVPFQMHRVRLPLEPGVPYFRTFCETNVRLYSVDKYGRRGVVFRSLDAARLIPALIGRSSVGLPYCWSRMRLQRHGEVISYTCQRRWPGPRPVRSRITIAVGQLLTRPSALEEFLTARWGLHVAWRGRTRYLPNEHPRWPLHSASLLDFDDNLIAAAGLPVPSGPPISVLYSPGVPVRFGMPIGRHP